MGIVREKINFIDLTNEINKRLNENFSVSYIRMCYNGNARTPRIIEVMDEIFSENGLTREKA